MIIEVTSLFAPNVRRIKVLGPNTLSGIMAGYEDEFRLLFEVDPPTFSKENLKVIYTYFVSTLPNNEHLELGRIYEKFYQTKKGPEKETDKQVGIDSEGIKLFAVTD